MKDMEIMSVENAFEFIEIFRKMYQEDYVNIKLSHGGSYLTKNGQTLTLGMLEDSLNRYERENKYRALIINGHIAINVWQLLDADNINLNMIDYTKEIN